MNVFFSKTGVGVPSRKQLLGYWKRAKEYQFHRGPIQAACLFECSKYKEMYDLVGFALTVTTRYRSNSPL